VTHEIEWMMKSSYLLASAHYGN